MTTYNVTRYTPTVIATFTDLLSAQEWLDEHAEPDCIHEISSNSGQHEDDAELEALYAPGGARIDLDGIAAPTGSYCGDAVPFDDSDEPPTSVIVGGSTSPSRTYTEQDFVNAFDNGSYDNAALIARDLAVYATTVTDRARWLNRAEVMEARHTLPPYATDAFAEQD